MPTLFVWVVGAVGAAAVARWLVKEARRINDELDALKAQSAGEPAAGRQNLERDPETGVYRPSRRSS